MSLEHTMPAPNGHSADGTNGAPAPGEVSVQLDLLRADLYRLLDELVRAPAELRDQLVREFENAWERFMDATAQES